MKQKNFHIIAFGTIFILVLALSVFLLLNRTMNKQTDKDIATIARTYVLEMTGETLEKFHGLSDVYYDKNTQFVKMLLKDGQIVDAGWLDYVKQSAVILQDISLAAFLEDDGQISMIAGDLLLSIDDLQNHLAKVAAKKRTVTTAYTKTTQYIIWINPVELTLPSGKKAVGMLEGIPMPQFLEKIGLSGKKGICTFDIIHRDGSYLAQGSIHYAARFLTEIFLYTTPKDMTSKEAALRLLNHMEEGKPFSMSLHFDYDSETEHTHENRIIYCIPISGSEWYFLATLPYGVLDKMIESMASSRSSGMWRAFGLLTVGILIVFFFYLRQTQRHVRDLTLAQERAVLAKNEAESAKIAMEHASQAKSEFLSNMSHDMRTPMNAIIGITTIAQQNKNDHDKLIDCVNKIALAGKHLLGLINDVLDMAKIETGKMTLSFETVSLSQCMKTIFDIVRPQIDANQQYFDVITTNISVEHVYCDGIRLNQILLNLLSNAMKFTPKGGSIMVNVEQTPSPKGEKYIRVLFAVRDTGIGMSPDFKDKLFTAFEREDRRRVQKVQGTGLGLAITKHIVDAMDGGIDVESTVGKGTTFTVTLDLERVNESEEVCTLPAWKILLVDDNKELCASTRDILLDLGTKPVACQTPEEAIKIVKESQAKGEDFFAAFIDHHLGKDNGIELAEKVAPLGNSKGKMPVTIISAYDSTDLNVGQDSCVTGFISKPIFKSAIYRELKRYAELEESAQGSPEAAKAEEFTLEGKHLLLAEDIDINAEVAMTILEACGASVDWAADGQICFEMFSKSAPHQYDAILMDLRMPNMTGYEATIAIRKLERQDAQEIPIVALTADAFVEDAQKCLAVGMNAHLAKPLDVERLEKTLAELIAARKNKAA